MTANNKQQIDASIKAPISCDVLSQTFDTSILYEAVRTPEGFNENEWIAQKVMDLFKEAQMAWGFVSNVCHCPLMRAHFMVFKWQEDPKKAAMPLPAAVYVKSLFVWIDSQISDTNLFPLKPGVPFSRDFQPVIKNLLRRLFRVYSHIYCHHWPHIESITATAHVNYCLRHFVYTVLVNDLLECNELKPLEELADFIIKEGASRGGASGTSSSGVFHKPNSGESEKPKFEQIGRNDISSPDTHVPSTNSLTGDSPISEDRIEISHTVPNSGDGSGISKNFKVQVSAYAQTVNKIQPGRVQSTCSDSVVIATGKGQIEKKDSSAHARKIKTYPWSELAKKLILCTKRKKKDGKLFSGFSTPKGTSENL
ncbi:MOB kinase activator 3C-like [Cryptosporidium felis]|nr:MOB kinase activator 3C-like [Cryptosporidium felis]